MQSTKLIGCSPLLANYAYSCSFFNLNSVYAQSLRWKRKPIWLPTAKTKVFRVPKRPNLPEDEKKEIQRLYNNYRTYFRSVRQYFLELAKQNEIQTDQASLDKLEEEDFKKCHQINEEWNKQIAAEREIRLQKEKEERKLKIFEGIAMKEKRDAALKLEIEQKVRAAKLLVPTLITRENIDQAIEEALAEVVDYNKALDLKGEWHTEKPGEPPTTELKKMQINQ